MLSERILVVDDEDVIRHVLSSFLSSKGCEVHEAGSAEEATPLLDGPPFGVALLDIVLPGINGLSMLAKIKEATPDTEVIMITSHASVDTATEAIRSGAYDYLIKPFNDLEVIWDATRRALEKRDLTVKNRQLIEDLEQRNADLLAAVKRRDALNEAGNALSGIHDLQPLLEHFLRLVTEELEVERASLMLLDDQSQELTIACARGLPEEVVSHTRVKIGDGIAGTVAKTGEPLLVGNASQDPRFVGEPRSDLSTSFLSAPIAFSIPIKAREKVLGVINLTDRRSGTAFDEEDAKYVRTLAGQAAIAIERAKYITALEKTIESLESTQEQLVMSERLKALGEMAAGVAHDFNNTLNGILLRSQSLLLKLKGDDPDLVRLGAELDQIEKLSVQGAETVKRIQEFTRIRKDQPKELVDFDTVVSDAVEMTRPKWKAGREVEGNGIKLDLSLGRVGCVTGTTSELVQAVSNLIFNAAEAMPEGGRLTIRTSREDDWIVLTVSDSGVGMTKEVQERLFEPFFSTKKSGQGLGGSIVYGIVRRHGGEITLDSREGEGTTFVVRLPVSTAVPAADGDKNRPAVDKQEAGLRPARVLVVDDDELNVEAHRTVLEDENYEVRAVTSAAEALSFVEREEIDVVITDLGMPDLCGWDVAKRVKELKPDVRVILVSGWAIQEEEERAKEAGVDVVLPKPCPLDRLLEAVAHRPQDTAADKS